MYAHAVRFRRQEDLRFVPSSIIHLAMTCLSPRKVFCLFHYLVAQWSICFLQKFKDQCTESTKRASIADFCPQARLLESNGVR